MTLDEVIEFIQQGQEVEIVDAKTGEDLTHCVLTQVIMDNQKKTANGLFNSKMLHQLIQYQDQSVTEFFQGYLPNILQSYIDWQRMAQNQFWQWAQLGFSANRYSREFFMPGLGMMPPMGQNKQAEPESEPPSADAAVEIEQLKARIRDLENRLNKSADGD